MLQAVNKKENILKSPVYFCLLLSIWNAWLNERDRNEEFYEKAPRYVILLLLLPHFVLKWKDPVSKKKKEIAISMFIIY